ncbi:Spectrin beta chain, non-erythrocytic 1 [Lamellibrachia satsuma]|nr:Spectrin beta chain, non-erythrocytic 1 [Lamellibrachia satsuma]
MFILRQLVEKRLDGQENMVLVFIDIERAYDTVPRDMDMESLRWVGVPEAEVRMVGCTYEETNLADSGANIQDLFVEWKEMFGRHRLRLLSWILHDTHLAEEEEGEEEMEDGSKFEKGRIQVLQQERVYIQKKTFTKWCNSFLEKARLHVDDLFIDLRDGKMLMKLLEIISGENLGRPNKGVLRVQKMENLNRCLMFLSTKVKLENMGAEDIVDGSPRLTLGLIWTIILRFQIQNIVIEVDEESSEKRSAKDALLLWCKRKTAGYRGVDIQNFSTSWRNGLGFNALIHAHRPDLIKYNQLQEEDHIANLNNAFNVADEKLGIAKLLDAEDVDVSRPDDKSVMTYIAAYYHYFAKMKSEMTGTKRVAKVIGRLLEIEQMQDDYETLVTSLLDWINNKITSLKDRNLPNSLGGIQHEMTLFKEYRTVEKPPKYRERGNIEAHFFNLQSQLKSSGQRPYSPPEGKLIQDIERAWARLEKAEHDRELALRQELIRQERLKQLAQKFERKAALRDSWLNDMKTVLSDQNFGRSTSQVEAALKKHEAISADIESRKDRFVALSHMAKELYNENYHARDRIKEREQQILQKWHELMELLEKKKRTLTGFSELLGMFREMESIQVEMKEMEPVLKSEELAKHLVSAEDLLHKHTLVETQLSTIGAHVRALNKGAQPYMKSLHPESRLLQKRLENLNKEYDNVCALCAKRKASLEECRMFYQFLQDSEEEEAWLVEKIRIVKSTDVGKDLQSVTSLLKKHQACTDVSLEGYQDKT